jgi:holin-like protein
MIGLAILLVFNFLGLLLHRYAHIPLPENILGMLLLFLALCTGVVKLAWVEEAADFLLRHMMLFFAPIIVGVLPLWDVLLANIGPAAGGLISSTLVTMAATAWLAQGIMRKGAADGR